MAFVVSKKAEPVCTFRLTFGNGGNLGQALGIGTVE
jgi:hypothetical protein